MPEKLITKSFERLLDKGKHRGFITYEELGKSLGKRNSTNENIVKEINENSNIQIIIKNKNDEEVLNLLDELLRDHREESNLRKIESLEQKLINNLDENSYSELIKLKSQLNRE